MIINPNGSETLGSSRLHRGLSLLFLGVLVVVGGIQTTYIFTRAYRSAEAAEEYSGAFLAQTLATALQPHLKHQDGSVVLTEMNKLLLDALPGARVYLVGHDGTIKMALGATGTVSGRIDTGPLEDFLSLPKTPARVLYARDPAESETKGDSAFAAARLDLFGEPGYVFITLNHTFLLEALRYQFDETLLYFILFAIGTQLIAVILIALFLFRVLTIRLRSLVSVLNRYTAGDHSARAEISGSDEIAELARTTNQMAETIEDKIEQLAERDRQRRELIADVSHDLRTPASVIRGYSEILSEKADSNTDQKSKEMYAAIIRSSDSLSTLLGQLWDLSKLEALEQAVAIERIPLAELLDEITSSYRVEARRKGISLISAVEESPRCILADPTLITRVIRNLIENALTYTHAGGTVEIRAIPSESGMRVEVHDTGVGISAEDLPQIFERSFRVKKWEGQRQDSGGLGLAIVRKILEAHGQKIEVQSQEDEGSTFAFELPWEP